MSGQCRVSKANFDVVFPTLGELETPNIVDTCLEAAYTQGLWLEDIHDLMGVGKYCRRFW